MTTAGPSPLELLRAVVAHGLPGGPPMPNLPSDRQRWRELLALAERQRVLGLLVAAIDDDGVDVGERNRAELLDLHRHWCAHDLRLERVLLQVADRLDEEGIDFVVLKGPALAHTRYRDPSLRLFADLDLLVRSGHVTAASAAIEDLLDARPALPELRHGFDDRFGKEVMLRTPATHDAPDGLEVDLHRTLIAGALGLTIPLDSLFADTATLVLGGRALPTLGPVATLLAACYQASISDNPPRLAAACDLAQIVADDPPPVAEVLAEARRWRATAVVTDALTRTWRTLDLPPDPFVERWLAETRPTRLERTLLRAHLAPGYVYWRHLAALLVLPGVGPRVRYALAIVAPQASYLDRRASSLPAHARRSWRSLNRPVREPLVRTARRVGRRFLRPG